MGIYLISKYLIKNIIKEENELNKKRIDLIVNYSGGILNFLLELFCCGFGEYVVLSSILNKIIFLLNKS